MRRAVLFLSGLLTTTILFAQCDIPVPHSPGHVQISNNQAIGAVGLYYWVCAGITLDVNSSTGSVFLLEEGAILNIHDTDGDQVYAKPNSTVNNNSDESINVISNVATVTLNNNSSGSMVTAIQCGAVTFDYQFVGGGAGCMSGGTTVVEAREQPGLKIYPVPCVQGQPLLISSGRPYQSVQIYDLQGQLVKEYSGEQKVLSTQDMDAGVYVVVVGLEDRILKERVLVLGE